MKKFKKGLIAGASVLSLCFLLMPMVTLAAEADPAAPSMYATFWALVPPVVAIVLALITKEVYSSLFVGILVGGLFYSVCSYHFSRINGSSSRKDTYREICKNI